MTLSAMNPALVTPPIEGPNPEALKAKKADEAAAQFEQLLLQQLVKVLRSTVSNSGWLNESSPGSEIYSQMFDESFAEALSKSGGIGLKDIVTESMGGKPEAATHQASSGESRFSPGALRLAMRAASQVSPSIQTGPKGTAVEKLEVAAQSMIRDPEQRARWSRYGELKPTDLASTFATEEPGGVARFNVQDARGYQGYYKCNLFALELARRAGYQVPVIGREHGWGYPAPDAITADASDGHLRQGWARVVTGASAAALQKNISDHSGAFLLTGSAAGDRAGHMAVIERIHSIDYGENGTVKRIVFDGWEARPGGAQHLTQRTWNLYGNPGGTQLARNGFDQIQILQLQQAPVQNQPEVPLGTHVGPSVRDNFALSSSENRPKDELEGEL